MWNPGQLKLSGTWEKDGPCLPIEFARKSKGKRLTLVLYPKATRVKTLWARAANKDLQESICDLAKREETSTRNIGFVSIPDNKYRCNAIAGILSTIKAWAEQKQLDAVVWTDLSSNFDNLTSKNVINYFRRLNASALHDAETYVRNAPQQIKTKIRAILEKEFGWTPVNTKEERDWSRLKKDFEKRLVDRSSDDSYWVVIPDKPATFGHLLVISWKGYQEQDITDKGLFRDNSHMQKIMRMIHDLAFEMKSCLTSNGEADGKKCKKVYLVSECETECFPFHFHLIPRFEYEKTGNQFLFEKELEEARFISEKDQEDAKIEDCYHRIVETEAILNYHKWLLISSKWARRNEERKEFVGKIMKWWSEHWVCNEPN